MAQKVGVVFEHGDELRRFLRGRNRIVEAWLNQNWDRLDVAMAGPVTRDTVSKVLGGRSVLEPVVKALHVLRDTIRANPWAWCKPPERVEDAEGIRDYAEYAWWYDVLQPSVSFSRFERMTAQPLPPDEREYLNERLSDWSSRLKGACDQFMADHELLRALSADDAPKYQYHGGRRGRVGNPGLHGRTPEEIGLAYALSRATLPLPLIEEARLAYERPNVSPVHDHVSEPIVPWMGLEFEGVEIEDWEDTRRPASHRLVLELPPRTAVQVEHKVIYYWDGSRYQVEDVEKFARIKTGYSATWRDTTSKERDLLVTGIERKHDTVEELLAKREAWIAEVLAEKPVGTTESEVVALFDAMVDRLRVNQDALREQEDLARARSKFKRGLRRRP
jgi:hypothetical protein